MSMVRHLGRAWDRDGAASLAVARAAFVDARPQLDEQARERAIAALPVVIWRGRRLHTIRCRGEFGKGPHDVNVPESILWALISLERFYCPFHR